MDDQQEQVIAQGLAEGKEEAWRALYEAYSKPVWQYVARRMGLDTADVADVVQETFLAAARSARQFDPARGSLWNWLCGIARNHLAQHFRRRRRDKVSAADDSASLVRKQFVDWLDHRHETPPEALAAAETASAVRATLAELPGAYETLLVAKYFDGDSVDQIAGREQSSSTAIRSKLARARRAFRRAYETTSFTSARPGGSSDLGGSDPPGRTS